MLENNPRPIDGAVGWQLRRLGSHAWEDASWKFQRLAYGFLTDDRWQQPAEALDWFRQQQQLQTGLPPRGALIWCDGSDGPVVRCALGDGRVIGPRLPDAVRIDVVEHLDRPGLSVRPLSDQDGWYAFACREYIRA